MALEDKTLTQLRGIWQGLDGKVDWGWDAAKLRREITARTKQVVEKPIVSMPPMEDQRLRIIPPARNVSQEEVWDALLDFREGSGLIVTFPTRDTIYMRKGKIEDSCSLNVPLRHIVDAAKRLLYESDRATKR